LIYKDETVRLTRELPEAELPAHTEGTVDRVIRSDDGQTLGAAVRFFTQAGTVVPIVPLDAIEPVLSSAHHRTAVFWGLGQSPEQVVVSAMHAMLDRGFGMRAGLNVVRLHYISEDRWWKWGDRMNDPTGAHVAVAAASWDGMVVALSGEEAFQLQFRLAGPKGATLLLHERDDSFLQQSRETHSAMQIARMLMALFLSAGAECCAFPVATPWLADEDWPSLLRPPHYPDFFILPQASTPAGLDSAFRGVKATDGRAIMTTMPMKFDPGETPVKRSDRELSLDQLRRLKALAEKYYDQMYETHLGLTGLYASAKDAFYDAISLANQLGMHEESRELGERLDHVKSVFRSQFS
jgi:hypothetical protein